MGNKNDVIYENKLNRDIKLKADPCGDDVVDVVILYLY